MMFASMHFLHPTGSGTDVIMAIKKKKDQNCPFGNRQFNKIWGLFFVLLQLKEHLLTCSFCMSSGNFNKGQEIMFSHLK